MSTPVGEPDRPDEYYYGHNHSNNQHNARLQQPQSYDQQGYDQQGYDQPPPMYDQPRGQGYGEEIEMDTYPAEPPPGYVQGNGQAAPITRRGDLPRPAGIPPPNTDPIPEESNHPIDVTCRHCGAYVTTSCNYKIGGAAKNAAVYMLVGCCIPCACIPLCKQEMKDVHHSCPECKTHLGTFIKPNEVRLRPGDKVGKSRRNNTY